jgi:dTDP-D-glucose 4,6-dehydratase
MTEPYYFGQYLDLSPITMNVTKIARVLGIRPTPFDAGLKETYRWYLRNGKRRADFEFEDHLLSMARPLSTAG